MADNGQTYYQAKTDGTYQIGWEPEGPDATRIRTILQNSLNSYGWNVNFDNISRNPYHGVLTNTNLNLDIYIYCWRISNGGRTNRPCEKRIQIGNNADRGPLARENQGNNRTLLLGIYEPSDGQQFQTPIIVAWESKKNQYAGSSKSCFTDVENISTAMRDGFSQYYNSDHDLVCAFRPEFMHFYIMNLSKLHNSEFACINGAAATEMLSASQEAHEDGGTYEESGESIVNKHNVDNNTILYGPPGTGKTYNVAKYAVRVIENKTEEEINEEEYMDIINRYNSYKEEGRVVFITFHQSYSYEEFIEGIKPVMNDGEESDIKYRIEDGVFKTLCKTAKDSDKNFVFIIDEINRGNISKIFGELITLIESKKRLGQDEETLAKLTYSKEDFGVPSNVYIIGTMNTADRSIALLDTALRRRFEFIEMMPDSNVLNRLNNNNDLKIIVEDKEINICSLLKTINKRIEVLYDREHTIGHAYFIQLVKEPTLSNLSKILKKKVIPLLQEYFYDDYEKIRFVLADNQVENTKYVFITENKIDQDLFGGDFDVDEKKTYTLNNNAFNEVNSYIKIYSKIEGNDNE